MAKRNAKSQIGSLTSTTKSRELTRFTCVRVVCDIPLENYWRGLQLCFKPHFNPRSTSEVMGSQSHDNPNFDNLSPHLAILRQNAIWMWALWRGIEYKGEGGGFPQVWAVVSLVSPSWPWLFLTPKALQLYINHLVLVLCRPMWVNEAYQFFLVPSQSSNMPLYPSKVLWAKERAPTPCSFVVFYLGLIFESLKELGTHH
jgi:hypothetical protein